MLIMVLLHVLTAYIFVMKVFNQHQHSYIGALSVCPNIILTAQNLNCFWLYYVRTSDYLTNLRTNLTIFLLTQNFLPSVGLYVQLGMAGAPGPMRLSCIIFHYIKWWCFHRTFRISITFPLFCRLQNWPQRDCDRSLQTVFVQLPLCLPVLNSSLMGSFPGCIRGDEVDMVTRGTIPSCCICSVGVYHGQQYINKDLVFILSKQKVQSGCCSKPLQ